MYCMLHGVSLKDNTLKMKVIFINRVCVFSSLNALVINSLKDKHDEMRPIHTLQCNLLLTIKGCLLKVTHLLLCQLIQSPCPLL